MSSIKRLLVDLRKKAIRIFIQTSEREKLIFITYQKCFGKLGFPNLLHCWQNLCWIPAMRMTGALAWCSHTLCRLWYLLASDMSTVQLSTWQEGGVDPAPPDPFLLVRVTAFFFFSSSPNPNPTVSSSSSSSSSIKVLLPWALLISILEKKRRQPKESRWGRQLGGGEEEGKEKEEKKNKPWEKGEKRRTRICEDHKLHFFSFQLRGTVLEELQQYIIYSKVIQDSNSPVLYIKNTVHTFPFYSHLNFTWLYYHIITPHDYFEPHSIKDQDWKCFQPPTLIHSGTFRLSPDQFFSVSPMVAVAPPIFLWMLSDSYLIWPKIDKNIVEWVCHSHFAQNVRSLKANRSCAT